MDDFCQPVDKQPDEVHDRIIPVVEEGVLVTKRTVETGKVTVTATPVTKVQTVSADLTRTSYHEERKPVNEIVETVPAIRREGDSIIIPVVEEEVILTKRLRLVEEIHLRPSVETETVERDVTLRATEVTVSNERS